MVHLRSTAVKVVLLCVALCRCVAAAELKIVGPATIPVGSTAFLRLEGVKQGEAFDYFATPITGSLVVLFDIGGSPVGVLNGESAGAFTIVAVAYDSEAKKIVRALHTITIGKPVPPDPTPDPDIPTPPTPVVEGKRSLLIIRESADSTPNVARMITSLRNEPHAGYLKTKGHTLSVLDDDAVDADGNPSPLVAAWREHFAGMTLPVLFIIDPDGNKLIHKESLPDTAGADAVMGLLRKFGG